MHNVFMNGCSFLVMMLTQDAVRNGTVSQHFYRAMEITLQPLFGYAGIGMIV